MKDDNNQELIRAIDKLTMAVRDAVTGGFFVIVGMILLHTFWISLRPESGLIGLVLTLATSTGAALIIWLGFNIMRG